MKWFLGVEANVKFSSAAFEFLVEDRRDMEAMMGAIKECSVGRLCVCVCVCGGGEIKLVCAFIECYTVLVLDKGA